MACNETCLLCRRRGREGAGQTQERIDGMERADSWQRTTLCLLLPTSSSPHRSRRREGRGRRNVRDKWERNKGVGEGEEGEGGLLSFTLLRSLSLPRGIRRKIRLLLANGRKPPHMGKESEKNYGRCIKLESLVLNVFNSV